MLNPGTEVLSPTTESDDRGPKLDCYELIASVRAVMLVAQDRAHVTVYERQPAGSLLQSDHDGGTLALAAIGCTVPIAEVYEDLPNP